jgi:hypothetical protein
MGTPVSATVGVTMASLAASPGTLTPTEGDPAGIGAGSVFKTAGLMPAEEVDPAARVELTDPCFVSESD